MKRPAGEDPKSKEKKKLDTTRAWQETLALAAQKAIANMRKPIQQHVLRLPISYFDSTKTGVLISRIMSDF